MSPFEDPKLSPKHCPPPPPHETLKIKNPVCDCAKVHSIFFHYNFKNWKVAGSLLNGNILIVILLQPFEEKLAKEENPDKKEMYKNIVAKATVAIEALDGILSGEKLALEELVKWKQVKQDDIKFHIIFLFQIGEKVNQSKFLVEDEQRVKNTTTCANTSCNADERIVLQCFYF